MRVLISLYRHASLRPRRRAPAAHGALRLRFADARLSLFQRFLASVRSGRIAYPT